MTPTTIRLESGTEVYLADKPCTGCGCYEAFVFECNCGAVHSDVCYFCGLFVDMQHKPEPPRLRCTAGHVKHSHEGAEQWRLRMDDIDDVGDS